MREKYVDHLPAGLEISAVRLYMDALRDKLMPIFGDTNRSLNLLALNLAPDRCLTALYGQKLVGVLGIQTAKGGFLNPTLKSLIGEYGLIGGFLRLGQLHLLHHETESDEWYVDGIAVVEEMRGLGIGTGLLSLLESIAKEKGIRKLSLEVTNTNKKAKALYERLGFDLTKQTSLWPYNRLFRFPFESAIEMVKTLPTPGASIPALRDAMARNNEYQPLED